MAATGIGKTYLAAFHSREFNRVLFVAHREEILKQAYESFANVRTDKWLSVMAGEEKLVADKEEILEHKVNNKTTQEYEHNMGFFMNSTKETKKDIIFASVQSLGKEKYLNQKYFDKDYFDYIVVDEFHHAVSKNYQNIINYFSPEVYVRTNSNTR